MDKTVAGIAVSLLVAIFNFTVADSACAGGGDLNWAYSAAATKKQDVRAADFDSVGNVILVGVDDEGANSDWFVAKVNADGSGLAWPKLSFDLAGGIDVATAVVVNGDDSIIVTGYGHNGSNYDIQTVKYTSTGILQWQHTYAGIANGDDIATAIGTDSSHNIYVGGYQQNSSGKDDFIVIKYLGTGPVNDSPLWQTTINGVADGNDRLAALAVNGSSLAVTGESESGTPGDFNFLTHKLYLDGTFAWPGPQLYSDSGNGKGLDIAIDGNGNVVATGYVDDGLRAMYTVKHSAADGSVVWSIQQPGETIEGGHAVVIDADNNVFVTGTSYSLTTAYDVYTAKYQGSDPVTGTPVVLWEDSYNTTNGNHDVGLDLVADAGGDLFVTAYSNDAVSGYDDILILKYDGDDGSRLWPQTLYDLAGLHNRPVAIGLGSTGSILVGGWADTAANNYDILAMSYDPGLIDPPTNLTASVVSNTEIHLSWTDNPAAENFVVASRKEGDALFTEITPALAAGTTSYNSTSLETDTRYYYKVKATSTVDGNSAWSETVDARTTVISYSAPTWMHLYAGASAGDDDPYAIATGADHNPVVTGASFATEGGYDYLTIKLDRTDPNNELWLDRYNDDDNEGDTATSIVVDGQNRVVVTGYSSLYGGGASNTNDIFTLGYPASGPPASWSDQYNGPSGNDDKSSAVAVATDGSDNTAVIGYGKNEAFDNDIYVLKFDPDGNRLWSATPYDSGDEDYPSAVAIDGSGNVFVAGRSNNGSDDDWFVARYAASDGSQTHTALPHAFVANGNDYAESIAIDAAGDVYVTGYAYNGSNGDIYTVKYSGADLSILWQQADDSGGYDHGAGVGVDPANGDILVAGTSFMGAANHDFRLIRYTAAGNAGGGQVLWNHRFNLSSTDDSVTAMAIDQSGVAVLTGTSDDDILTVKIDHNELIVGANLFDGAANALDYPSDVAINAYGEAFVAGSSMNADAVPNTDYVVFMADGGVLQAPTPLLASQLYAEVALSWSNNDLDNIGFRLERKLDGCASTEPWQPLGDFAVAVTGYTDTPVNDNTTYCYRVQSYSTTDSSRWVELNVTTADALAPGDLTALLLNGTDIQLTWTDNTTDASGYEFHINRCAGASCDFSTSTTFVVNADTVTNGETGVASWVDITACSGQPYRYRVLASKPGLWTSLYSAPTASAGITPVAPSAPSDLTADRVSETQVDLHWTDNSDSEDAFIVERCDGDAAACESGSWNTLETLSTLPSNILQLRMDEAAWNGTPGEVSDLSGQGNHATANGANTVDYGRFSRGGSLDGHFGQVNTPLVLDQSESSLGATFAAWVKPDAGVDKQGYLFDTNDGGNDWGLLHNGASWYISTGADDGTVDTGVSVDPGIWQHVSVSFDPLTGIKFFKNGSEVWADTDVDPLTDGGIGFDASSAPLTIGLSGVQANALSLLHMDEASWTNGVADVLDDSGHGNHGTSYNGLTTVAEGKFGRAGSFDGVDDHMTTAINVDQTATGPGATFEAWVYPTKRDTNYRHVISTDNGGYDWAIVQYYGTWYIQSGATRYSTSIPMDFEQWQHIVAVFDPATGVQFYKNGGENSYSNTNIGYDTSDQNVTIGRYANSTSANYHFQGRIDEVLIYDRPLSAGDVHTRYQQSSMAGIVDEVTIFDRPLTAAEVLVLQQNGIDRYTDSTVAVNTAYTYRVRADKAGGCPGDWLTAESTPLTATTVPPAPEVSLTVEETGRIRLNWLTKTTSQDGFKVLRCEGSSCTPSAVLDDTLGASVTEFADTTTCAGQTYRYQVLATDSVWGDSEPSLIVSGTTPAIAVPQLFDITSISEGHAVLEWTYAGRTAAAFNLGYCDNAGSCTLNSDFTTTATTGLPGNQLLLHMDEVTRSHAVADVIDSSGNNLHGTSYNGVAAVSDGQYGWANSFDGSNDYIATPLNIDQSATGPGATFEAWVYPTLQDTNYRQVISTDNGGYDWAIVQYNGLWYIQTGSSRYSTNIPVSFNQWQHIVGVFAPGTGVQFYKNGGQGTFSTTNMNYDTSDANVTIGRYASSSDSRYHFPGRIDEIAIYDRPLSLAEVQERYVGTKYRFTASVLTPSTNYTFRVWAKGSDACSTEGSPVDLTDVVNTTTTAALPPTSLAATNVGTTQVNLTWVVPATSETQLRVERCTGTSLECGIDDANFDDFNLTPVTLAADATSFNDSTICAESAYTYRVRVERGSAPTWQSNWGYVERGALTLPGLSGLTASGVSESEILVLWDDATPDESVFVLERCQDADFSCATPTLVDTEPASVLNYHFDEASWSNGVAGVLDDTDASRNGTPYNGANTVADGYFDRSGDFPSDNDFLVSPLNLDQSSAGPGATLQAWVKPTLTSPSYHQHVISTENGGYDWSIVTYNGYWYVYTGINAINTGKTVELGEWQHVAAVFDPATGVQFYKNGDDVYTTPTINFDTSDSNVTIGRYANSSSTAYNYIGQVDEVVVHSRPLTAGEVLENYLSPYHGHIDTGLATGSDYSYRLTVTKEVPGGCDWSDSAIYNTATLSPPMPENFATDSKNTTELHLTWLDKSGSETEYQLQRCDDTAANCGVVDGNFVALDETLPEDAESYSDLTVCPNTPYTYRIRARKQPLVPDGWDTGWVYHEASTDPVEELSGFSLNRISEVQIDLHWNDINNDETGFVIERCLGSTCDFSIKDVFQLTDDSAALVYQDDALEPNQAYRYQVKAHKSASCSGGWETSYAGPLAATVDVVAPNLISAVEMSTTRIDLEWTSHAPSATGTVIERCNDHPCTDAYLPVGTARQGENRFVDNSVCQGNTYSYRVKSVGEGLSGAEAGCWNRRAKVNVVDFTPGMVFEIEVPIDDDMRSDFADLRFFDETIKRELNYWIEDVVDEGLPTAKATILVRTENTDNIYLYYGNSTAISRSNKGAFVLFEEDFSGSQIDTGRWVDLDPGDFIVQNDGLRLYDLVNGGSWGGLVSVDKFERGSGLEALFDVAILAETDGVNYFSLGWGKDQSTSTSSTYWAHTFYFYNNSTLRTYENGTMKAGTNPFVPNNQYTVRIAADPVDGGARYYVMGGAYPDWTLILDTTFDASRYTDTPLRLSIMNYAEDAEVSFVQVRHSVSLASISLAGEETVACSIPGFNWESGYSSEDVWQTTRAAIAPTLDSVSPVDDTTVALNWTNNSDDDVSFDIQRCCGDACTYGDLVGDLVGLTSYVDAAVPPSSSCSYRLYAKKETGHCNWNEGPSNVLAVETYAASPTGLSAVAENSRLIRLEWSDVASDEDGFELQVKNGAGEYVSTAKLGANYEIHFDGRNIEPGKTYNYRIRSFRKVGVVEPFTFEWSSYTYSNPVTTPAWNEGDRTCLP